MWRRTPTSIAAAGRKIGTPRAGRPPTDPGRRPPSPWPAGPSSTASPRTACTGRSRTKTGTDVHGTDGRGWTSGVSTCSGRATASGPGGATQQPRGRAGCPATRAGARAQAHARSRGAAASDPDGLCRGAPARRGGGRPPAGPTGSRRRSISPRTRPHCSGRRAVARSPRSNPATWPLRGCGRDRPPTTAGLARTTITSVPEAPASHLVLDLDVRPVLDCRPVERHGGGLG